MTYELILLPCPANLVGAAAAVWFAEHEDVDDELDLSPAALAAWDDIVAAATPLLADAEVAASGEHAELTWPDEGLVVEYWPDEVTIELPYWHDDAAAVELVAVMYRIAEIVSSRTGLRAFDPQLGRLAADADPAAAAAHYARTRSEQS